MTYDETYNRYSDAILVLLVRFYVLTLNSLRQRAFISFT